MNTDSTLIENGGRIMTFLAGGKPFAFDIMDITDIIEIPHITLVPKLPKFIKGVINHRGRVMPIMDFEIRLSLKQSEYDEKSCVIIIEIDGSQMGVIVPRVLDVETVSPQMVILSPDATSITKGYIQMEERITLIDCGRLCNN